MSDSISRIRKQIQDAFERARAHEPRLVPDHQGEMVYEQVDLTEEILPVGDWRAGATDIGVLDGDQDFQTMARKYIQSAMEIE